MINKPSLLKGSYNRDPHIKALKRRGLIKPTNVSGFRVEGIFNNYRDEVVILQPPLSKVVKFRCSCSASKFMFLMMIRS